MAKRKTKPAISAIAQGIVDYVAFQFFDEIKKTLASILGSPVTLQEALIGTVLIAALGLSLFALVYSLVEVFPSDDRLTRLDDFHGWIAKSKYELGEHVFFQVRFKGLVRFGYYQAKIIRPDKFVEYSTDPETFHTLRAETKGSLSGEIKHDAQRWGWIIPMTFPLGKYVAHIGVYETYSLDSITSVRVRLRRNWLIRKFWRLKGPLDEHGRGCLDETTVRFSVVEPSIGELSA